MSAVREWLEREVGPVTRARRLPGGSSARLDAVDAGGGRYVLKRYVNAAWLAREPDLAAREALALEVLRSTAVTAPALVAVDPDGSSCGAPALLMTRLPGRHHWNPPSIERLAEVATCIHAVPVPRGFRSYRRYVVPGGAPPPWTSRPELWARALDVADRAVAANVCFIHRDHHAGNVLWSRGRVSGVVDWVEACVGPPAVDAARARLNLVWEVGVEAAAAYAQRPGVIVDPVWDIVDAVDALWGHGPDVAHRSATEDFVARALAELG